MNVEYVLKIEQLDASINNEEHYMSKANMEYTSDIIAKLKSESKSEEVSGVLVSLPEAEEVKVVLEDITKFYTDNFEISKPVDNEENTISVRFFPGVGSNSECGDFRGGKGSGDIRIAAKDIFNDRGIKKGRHIEYKKADLWYLLAHECYHAFQQFEFDRKSDITHNNMDIHSILAESFAQYFALSYISYFIKNDLGNSEIDEFGETEESKEYRIHFNTIVGDNELKKSILFGIGRKQLIKDKSIKEKYNINDAEVQIDDKLFDDVKEIEGCKSFVSNQSPSVAPSEADYGGGYIIYRYDKEKLCGKDLDLYRECFNLWSEGNDEEAFAKLLQVKDLTYKEYFGENPILYIKNKYN